MFGVIFAGALAAAATRDKYRESVLISLQNMPHGGDNIYHSTNGKWYCEATKEEVTIPKLNAYGEYYSVTKEKYSSYLPCVLKHNMLWSEPLYAFEYEKELMSALEEGRDFIYTKNKNLCRDLETGYRMKMEFLDGARFLVKADSHQFIKYIDSANEIDLEKYRIAKAVWHIWCYKARIIKHQNAPLWAPYTEYRIEEGRTLRGMPFWNELIKGIDFSVNGSKDYTKFERFLIARVNNMDWDGKLNPKPMSNVKYFGNLERPVPPRDESAYITLKDLHHYYRNVKIKNTEVIS